MTACDVRVVGSGPRVVLVPGVACDDTVWSALVGRWADHRELHLVRVAGFAGRPPVAPPLLPRVEGELIDYVRSLDSRPAVIGHSMGGAVALALAAAAPDAVGRVVVVDAAPDFASLRWPHASPEERLRRSRVVTDQMASRTPAQLRRDLELSLAAMVTTRESARALMELAEASDPVTVGRAMRELYERDLSPLLPSIRSRVLVLLPEWPGALDSRREHLHAHYRQQLAAIRDVEIRVCPGARHFIMLDVPELFSSTVERFLDAE
jgi:pimeloyl-ACP methyl ester carboxylesterase